MHNHIHIFIFFFCTPPRSCGRTSGARRKTSLLACKLYVVNSWPLASSRRCVGWPTSENDNDNDNDNDNENEHNNANDNHNVNDNDNDNDRGDGKYNEKVIVVMQQ